MGRTWNARVFVNETGKASEGGAKGCDRTDDARIPLEDLYGAPDPKGFSFLKTLAVPFLGF